MGQGDGSLVPLALDLTDRLQKYVETGTGYSAVFRYNYDDQNRLSTVRETINGWSRLSRYSYNDDNTLESFQKAYGFRYYTYDGLKRVTETTTKDHEDTVFTTAYTYKDTDSTASGQIASIQNTSAGIETPYDVTYSYIYDDRGNILSVTAGNQTTSYEYDLANQLTRENNQAGNFTHTWEYDNAGNILCRKEYAYTTGSLDNATVTDTVNYTYDDDWVSDDGEALNDSEANDDPPLKWGDLLASYDGVEIEYDQIGNPLTDGTWTYTWQHGRELATMSKDGVTWNYSYNADGLRTKRTDGSKTYTYVYDQGTLVRMKLNGKQMMFSHTPDGAPLAIVYDDLLYYYVTNLQGDVVAILDAAGNKVVEYTYDAWGNLLSCTGTEASTLGVANPLRYRGYVYDTETGLYYLQSRYYDPEMGRFINADGLLSTGQGLLGHNMFAYCGNNPIMGYDPSGEINWCGFWTGVAIVAVGVAIVASAVATGGASLTATGVLISAAKVVTAAVGVAVAATGVTTTYGAITEKPIVADVSYVDGNTYDKRGYSVVLDFDSNSVGIDTYYHYGKTTARTSVSYGTGFVDNYENPGDYGGYFLDANGTCSHNGIDFGIDACADPFNLTDGCRAGLFTVGFSGTPDGHGDINGGVDYYLPVSYTEIRWD